MLARTIDNHHGRPVRATDRGGAELWTAYWHGNALAGARLRLPGGGWIGLAPDADAHPIFGPSVGVWSSARGQGRGASPGSLARFGAVSWARPDSIPPLDDPGALPTGAGAAVLNLLAVMAERAGVDALRYRGPYPTATLFDALRASFAVRGDVHAARQRFDAEAWDTALAGRMREVDVDFEPRPFAWQFVRHGVCVQWRRGIERVYIGRSVYAIGRGARRLQRRGEATQAVVAFGDHVWADRLTLDADGAIVDGPHPLPRAPVGVVGLELPTELSAVVGELLAGRGDPLAATVRSVLGDTPLRFADTGDALARPCSGAIELHAGLAGAIETMPGSESLALVAEAIEPVARRLAQARLAAVLR